MDLYGDFTMNKIKRILALAGAVFLACIYIATLVFALIDSPAASGFFRASVAATILVPVLLYGYILIARLLRNRHTDTDLPSGTDNDMTGGE